ncbi:TAT-variant-translocated molybdopterin oxidoreductase [Cytophagales bacterium LB-30]|uniref:TAT-variant-translocated molybdopterin oxidoreductase n=1 Tax=Shiella aurantiaca TaxID=3058365 RepID=A0ABT8F446_9BACT|nr:TAT-variant-translocated molybdopterin oxidoreductase [Shiella aurantiaca]MDN4165158.1 TAT-variant-translocated molybdopterin oxidoreductase [Shiella aurantiaca]
MKQSNKQYWKGIEQLTNSHEVVKNAEREFPEFLPINENGESGGSSRRDFLKLMGFGIAAVSLAACEAPVRKAIPYLNKPVDVDPGVANYYASTYSLGGNYCSIVVKTREGRPIKIEGNKLSNITKGGTNAQVEASVLSLYDKERLTGPKAKGADIDWVALDKEVISKLEAIAAKGGQIRIVSNSILSPTTKKVIADFKAKYPTTEHVTYDADSVSAMVEANSQSFGQAVIPSYNFDKAQTIVSFAADFLGTWISPIEFTKQYAVNKKLGKDKKTMSRHYQFESNLSLSGSNADYRTPVKASELGLAVAHLYNALAAKAGLATVSVKAGSFKNLDKAANDLWNNKGKSLVVAGTNDVSVQVLVNAINSLLDNYSSTINLAQAVNYRQGNDKQMAQLVADAKAGKVDGVIFYNCNPVYDHASGTELAAALAKVGFKLSTSDRMDETASLADFVAPDHHFLESWNDAEPKVGSYSLGQPTISPIFKTRQAQASFLVWAGGSDDYYNYLRNNWKSTVFSKQTSLMDFNTFWDKTLYDGVIELGAPSAASVAFAGDVAAAAASLSAKTDNGPELVIYQKVGIGTGNQANNPWLQEMPDPISKATWDNYLTISQAMATEMGITFVESNTSLVNLKVGGKSVTLPVLVQPGQANGTVGLAMGYGREKAGRVANGVGVNAYPFLTSANGFVSFEITSGVSIEATGEKYQVPQTQTHQTYMKRQNIVQESVLSEYVKDASAGRFHPHVMGYDGEKKPSEISLWSGHTYSNHHWGLVVDLNSCTGCSACTIACQAENNVPVVGRQEVLNRREMHWIRIDRYYSSDADANDVKGLEIAAENPEVVFQPMMCQHCNNAPCETVCPVAATTHSSEGLNQMTYNRCIGTRYCANNCPYKVRRFNWFKYHDNEKFAAVNVAMNDDLGKMVLNPDVTVRSRGVMEKCSLCVQRIQAGKLTAKKEGRRTNDDDVTTACASACPADALIFGDMNDANSKISKFLRLEEKEDKKVVKEERAFHMLEEINVNPNVFYLTKIRNKDLQENNV